MWTILDIYQRPKRETIHFSKLEIENTIAKYEIGFLKSKIQRLEKKIKKLKLKENDKKTKIYRCVFRRLFYKK